jgi:hypothetical protein
MLKSIVTAILFLSASFAQANTSVDRVACSALYRDAENYLAKANGILWAMHSRGEMDFDAYSAAHHSNTTRTFDYFWRINRNSRVGTHEDCRADWQKARSLIDDNMNRIFDETNPRKR